jgi:hypothetical protein
MRLEVHSEAREEFLQAVSFYEAQVPGLGFTLYRRNRALPERIARNVADWASLRQASAEIHGWRQISLFNCVRGSRRGIVYIGVRSWLAGARLLAHAVRPLTIGWSDRGRRLR